MVSRDTPINIAVTHFAHKQVARFVAAEKRRARRTAEAYARRHHLAELAEVRTAAAAAQVRVIKTAIRDLHRARREAGRLFDTTDLAVSEAIRRELLARGLAPDAPPPPPPAETGRSLQGRPLGGSTTYTPARINARIPATYAAGVAVAAWQAEGCREAWHELVEFDELHQYDGFPK